MTKAKPATPIAIDLEFEVTSTAMKENAQKGQTKVVESPTIAFSLDEEFLKTKNESKNDNVIDINNIAKTQKDESKAGFKGFDISLDDLNAVEDAHDKTQATMLLTAAHLKELEKAKKAEETAHKATVTNHKKDKTDSHVHTKVKPIGIKGIGSKTTGMKSRTVDLNLLDNLDKVEGIDPSSLTSEFSLKELNEHSESSAAEKIVEEPAMDLAKVESSEEVVAEEKIEAEVEDNNSLLALPTEDFSELEKESDAEASVVEVEAKGNELELGEASGEFEMLTGSENDQPAMQIESNIMDDMIQMDDLTQEFQIDTEKNIFKTESFAHEEAKELKESDKLDTLEEAQDSEEIKDLQSPQGTFDGENELDPSLFIEEKDPSEPKLNFTQSEILVAPHNNEEDLDEHHDETKEFSLEEALKEDEDASEIFSLEEHVVSQEEHTSEMPSMPEDVFVASAGSKEALVDKTEFYKQIQKYRDDREKIIIEESNVAAMIRELREDRDRLLLQVSQLTSQFKDNEQMLLTLRASLEESRIENSILKKRQNKEVEEARYLADVNEDRMQQAIEAAKISEEKVVKLQQAIRIDFNQVKQREKELESKLELLMMDFDAQVKSRDQKILDLRRKLDSLEFNLETTNLREQKTIEEKKRIEDRLTKIMKTLKHSLHTLEDEVDAPNANMVNKKR